MPFQSKQDCVACYLSCAAGKEWKKPVRNPDKNSRVEAGRDCAFVCVQIHLWIALIDEIPGSLIDYEGFPGDSDGG